jgi:putative transposase
VSYLIEAHALSIRKACAAIGLSRAAWYRPLVDWFERDCPVAEALCALAEKKPGLGFWKLFRRLRRLGHEWNHKRVYRVYCLLKLNLRRRPNKRLPPRDPMPLVVPERPNEVWSADFMSDALYNGVRFRTFNVLDDFNREALTIEIDTSLPSSRLVRVFEQLKAERGLPNVLRTDNGPEFLGEAFTSWCADNGILIDYIEPGKPNQNAYIERFNRTYRHEVLNAYVFESLRQVRRITRAWIDEYNEERPHDSLGKIPPAMFRRQIENAGNSTLELSP